MLAGPGAPDPAMVEGTDEEIYQPFKLVAMLIQRCIELFCSLPFNSLDRLKLEALTWDIGKTS